MRKTQNLLLAKQIKKQIDTCIVTNVAGADPVEAPVTGGNTNIGDDQVDPSTGGNVVAAGTDVPGTTKPLTRL